MEINAVIKSEELAEYLKDKLTVRPDYGYETFKSDYETLRKNAFRRSIKDKGAKK